MKTQDRPSMSAKGTKSLWYPHAEIIKSMKPSGKYTNNYPVGAVVHWTSGWSREGDRGNTANEFAKRAINYGARQGYCYFTISETGQVYQSVPLDSWGSHAGKGSHPKLGTSLSSKLVGIEVCCAGRLTKKGSSYVSWFGAEFGAKEVRYSPKKDNIAAGYYHKYSEEQEKSLIDLLLWLHTNNPSVFNLDYVVGHDTISPGRKTDPGGSLSMTIPELVKLLKSKV